MLAEAEALFRTGDVEAAEPLLRRLISREPNNAPGLNLLALITGRSGRNDECVTLLKRAVKSGAGQQAAASANLLGAAYERSHSFTEAEQAYRLAITLAPTLIEYRLKLSVLFQRRGLHLLAIQVLIETLALHPASAPASGMLAGSYLTLGRLSDAAVSAARAVDLAPDDPAFLVDLALIRNAQGAHVAAEILCRRSLEHGEDAAALNTLGVALKEQGRIDEGAICFDRARAMRPNFIEALYNLAAVRKDQARTEDAIALLRQIIEFAPDLAVARFALCTAHLPPIYTNQEEVDRRRGAYSAALSDLAATAERLGAGVLATGVGATQPFYLSYQGRNDVALQRQYGELVCRAMLEAYPPTAPADSTKTGERIKLGFVCGYFRDHSVWRLPTRGWVQHLDRRKFELIGYHTSALRDDETDYGESLFDRFIQGPLPFEAWRQQINSDRPHALLYPEVGMDPMVARIAALRLAPIQYASWGHPATTGYPTIDYFLSSDAMEPQGAEAHYTETLIRLPGLSAPVPITPFCGHVSDRASLGLSSSATVYWCGQTLSKYLPQHDWIFAAIAQKVDDCQFVFIEHPGSVEVTTCLKARLAIAFSNCGLTASDFCVWLPRTSQDRYIAALGSADVMLDSIGWSGCNTLVDALRHNLPIVTMPGEQMRSRHGAAILHVLGADDLICGSVSEYVEAAATLANGEMRNAIGQRQRLAIASLAATSAVEALESIILDHVGLRLKTFGRNESRVKR